jgi:tetratricopeptide (TPR) repeat protein
MIRTLCACLLTVVMAAPASAEATLKAARERWLRGNYDEALTQYEELLKDAKQRSAAAVGISRVHQSRGDYDKALSVVDTALADDARNADLLARKAEVLHLRGKWDDAEKTAGAALAISKDHFAARWVLAQIYRDRGDLKKADDECRWFVRTYSERSDKDMDIKDPDELLRVGLAGVENARWHNLSDQFTFILNDVYADAVKNDKAFWPAEVEAGLLLLEKYNRPEASAAFDRALTTNPQCAEALTGKGLIAMQQLDLKEAENYADRALKVNPSLPEALRLRADFHLFVGDVAKAMANLDKARAVNARDERTLARIAVCLKLQHKDDAFDKLVKEIAGFDTSPALFWLELGEKLDERRLFTEAKKCYVEAAKLRPKLAGPLNGLGLLYMRMGMEKEAGEMLDKGFEADPFNVRVSNTRKVLKHLGGYATLKTEHFELRYDPKSDGPLARYMGEQLEAIYADLAKKFNHEPKGPILIEVFNAHMFFSARVIALPDLHTIGACTGRMIALASPHAVGVRQPFNWSRVLRHEIVHIFNLDQTDFLVPHWLTEGLAVSNEGFPRPQVWNLLLLERVPSGELMDLDNINLGFMRPKTPADWQMAYCQSLLYVQFIEKTYGEKAIGELLAAYKDGLDTSAAIRNVCKVSKDDFEKAYRDFLKAEVQKISGKPPEKRKTFADLKAAYQKDPKDADAVAALAEAHLERRERKEARELAEAALVLKKDHPVASVVLARLERLAGNTKKERELLEAACTDKDKADPKLLAALGKIYYDAEEFTKAAEVYEAGRKAEPLDNEWLQQLARVYARSNNIDKLIGVLKDLVPTDADQLDWRRRLSRLLLEKEDFAGAEKYAREALEIDVADSEAQETLFKALKGQKKDEEEKHLRKILTK